jgi:hypothetical protein
MSLEPLGLPPSRQTRVLLPDDPETVAQLREQRNDARDMVQVLQERVDSALRLHRRVNRGFNKGYCLGCAATHPCPTVRLLTDADEDES